MASDYPTSIDSFTANTDNVDVILAEDVNELQDAIEALEVKVGADSSAVTSTHDYKLSGVTGTDKAVSKTGTETLTNKTLGTGTAITLGSDAEGDTYYRNAAGALVRLPKGTDNHILKMNGNVPNWEAETTTVNGSVTVSGVYETGTAAEINTGTATGGTGAELAATSQYLATSAYNHAADFFGNGADGDVTISGNTSLTRDMYYNNLTINTGCVLSPKGYRIFVKGTLTRAGTGKIESNGGAGGNGGNGSSASAPTAGTAGAADYSTGSLPIPKAGVAGGTGTSATGSGGNNGTAAVLNLGLAGSAGGTGGSGTFGAGGTAGTAGAVGTAAKSIPNAYLPAYNLYDLAGSTLTRHEISGGSGSGSQGGGNNPTTHVGGAGGGSGATGGCVWIAARIIGTIEVNATGGNGGNGGNGTSSTSGGGGGGAGGNGGIIILIYKQATSVITSVAGGTGGTGGTAGGTSNAGTNGTNGNAGVVFSITV